jgi:hypothetical protein
MNDVLTLLGRSRLILILTIVFGVLSGSCRSVPSGLSRSGIPGMIWYKTCTTKLSVLETDPEIFMVFFVLDWD